MTRDRTVRAKKISLTSPAQGSSYRQCPTKEVCNCHQDFWLISSSLLNPSVACSAQFRTIPASLQPSQLAAFDRWTKPFLRLSCISLTPEYYLSHSRCLIRLNKRLFNVLPWSSVTSCGDIGDPGARTNAIWELRLLGSQWGLFPLTHE